jgi:hypothetical protein
VAHRRHGQVRCLSDQTVEESMVSGSETLQSAATSEAVASAFGARVFHDCSQRARKDFGVCNYRFADRSRSERDRQLCGHDPSPDSPRLVDLQKLRASERSLQKGEPEGPALLRKILRGEDDDWKAVEDKHTPNRMCSGPCLSVRFKDEFGAKQWKNAEDPLRKACVKRLEEQGTPYRCTRCRRWFAKQSFADGCLNNSEAKTVPRLRCSPCPSVAASAKRTNHPQTSQRESGRRSYPSVNAKNACSGGLVVFARNRRQNANLQLENGSSRMRNVHAFNARSIVAPCAKKKRRANCGFLVNNPRGMLQTVCAAIVTGSVAAAASRKTATRTFLMRYGIWM